MLNVAVLIGGKSVEHEVAVITAMQMIENLDKSKYNIIPVYINNKGRWFVGDNLDEFETYKSKDFRNTREVYLNPSYGDNKLYVLEDETVKGGLFSSDTIIKTLKPYKEIDVALLGLHGTNGEDGTIQGLLETIGIPYTGGNVVSSSVGMDKVLMKDVYRAYDIPLVEYEWFYKKEWDNNQDKIIENLERIPYPLIVKPSNLGSSVGISIATNREELVESINIAKEYDKKIIVERAIENLREINCAVLGYEDDLITSVLEEPIGWEDFQTFENKYNKDGGTSREIPAEVPKDIKEKIEKYSKESFRSINCSGTARIDFLLEDNKNVYVNEINTLPGSSSHHLWEETGITFTELLDRLIEIAIKESDDQKSNMTSFESDIFQKTTYGTKMSSAKGATK